MFTHDFAKKTKKIERERENNEKTMLYIFRYFKEIQKGIFVIKTMFETVLFGLIYVVLNLVRTFYTFSFFVPFLFGAILKQQVALLYQSSPASLLLSLLQKEFWFAHMCCVFCFFLGGFLSLCGVFTRRNETQKSFVWSDFNVEWQNAPDPARSLAVWGNQMCEKRHWQEKAIAGGR